MKHAKLLSSILIILLQIGCSAEQSPDRSPDQVYREYNANLVDGMSFDEIKAHHTERKQNEVEQNFPRYMKQMNKTRDEVVEFYVKFSREVAKCTQLTLVDEAIEGDTARLEYSRKDTCGDESQSTGKEMVTMKKEDGWKIDEVEVVL